MKMLFLLVLYTCQAGEGLPSDCDYLISSYHETSEECMARGFDSVKNPPWMGMWIERFQCVETPDWDQTEGSDNVSR